MVLTKSAGFPSSKLTLVHTRIHVGAYLNSCWCIPEFMLVHTIIHVGAYLNSCWCIPEFMSVRKSGSECSARLDKVSKYVRDLGEMSGEELFQRSYVCRIQVEESETSRQGQMWF